MGRAKKNENSELTSKGLTQELWNTLLDIRKGEADPSEANAVAAQSREICRVVNTQINAFRLMGAQPTAGQKKALLMS